MMRRVNWSITTRTQCVLRVADSQRNRSQLHRLSFAWPRNVSQEGPPVRFRSVVNAQNASHNILVDLDAKRERDLWSNAGTTPSRVAPFHCDNRVNEIFLRALRTRPMPALRRKQQAILPFAQRTVKMQQRGSLKNDGGTQNARGAHQEGA